MPNPFVPARYFHPAGRKTADYVVVHAMQLPCQSGMAQHCAEGFQKIMNPDKVKSAHYCVDPESVVQCVHEYDVAWHCPKGNARGVGVEHSGYGPGTEEEVATDWTSGDGLLILQRSAKLAAEIAQRWAIPLVRLTPAELKGMTARGFAGHVDFTKAFTPGGHSDPGDLWPWDQYLELVQAALAKLPTPTS